MANTLSKSGVVQSFNFSPKGSYEGLLVETKTGLLQINFPQELAPLVASMASPGESINAKVRPEEPNGKPSAHPVFRLVQLKTADGRGISAEPLENGKFSGTVDRLNYALHGEVNGGVLDSGDFIHLKPHGAAAVELKVGLRVSGKGVAKPSIEGHRAIEVEEINGTHLEKPKKKAPAKKKATHL